jgi:hypothetical protein
MKGAVVVVITALALRTSPALGQTAADSAAIKATALDYIQGWYEGNAERMERAVHPHLAKRLVYTDRGRSRLIEVTAMDLVQGSREGDGKLPPDKRRTEVKILDIFENAGMVRIDATDWVDYLQVAKWNGRWVIINVVWENRPK